jgi:flagellar basal-body rod protein FlgF
MTMDNTGYVALSHQMVLQRQMEVIAHNIANANTGAYKGDQTLFETFLMDGGNNKKIAYVQDFGVLINFREGQLESTGNQLDIAVQGPGFLVAQTPNGPAYTRAGHLTVNQNGELATEQGDPILAENRQPIVVADPTLGDVIINPDGTISVNNEPPVRLLMVEFDNPRHTRPAGDDRALQRRADPRACRDDRDQPRLPALAQADRDRARIAAQDGRSHTAAA